MWLVQFDEIHFDLIIHKDSDLGKEGTLGFVVTEYSYCKVWAWKSLHFNLALVWSSRLLNLLTNDGLGGAECLALIVVIIMIGLVLSQQCN